MLDDLAGRFEKSNWKALGKQPTLCSSELDVKKELD